MSGKNNLVRKKIHRLQTNAEAFPGVPVVEIAGDSRVLIENHIGILEYGYEKITVKVNYGTLLICGNNLTMAQMTTQQLVIMGRISSVSIVRSNRK